MPRKSVEKNVITMADDEGKKKRRRRRRKHSNGSQAALFEVAPVEEIRARVESPYVMAILERAYSDLGKEIQERKNGTSVTTAPVRVRRAS